MPGAAAFCRPCIRACSSARKATRCSSSPIRPGMSAERRRQSLDALSDLNQMRYDELGDPEIATRIAAYELAYRMQTSVPE